MFSRIDSPIGALLLETRDGAVRQLRLWKPDDSPDLDAPDAVTVRAEDWLRRYFAGQAPAMDLPLAPEGTAFRRRVWKAAVQIPYGRTLSYGQLAERVGCRNARAVGAALGANPILILIPCHRILGADGSLTGFAAGLERKRALLEREGIIK